MTWNHKMEYLGRITMSTIAETGTERPIAKTVIDTVQCMGFIIPHPDSTFYEAAMLKNSFKDQGIKTIVLMHEDFAAFLDAKVDSLDPIFVMAAKHILEGR